MYVETLPRIEEGVAMARYIIMLDVANNPVPEQAAVKVIRCRQGAVTSCIAVDVQDDVDELLQGQVRVDVDEGPKGLLEPAWP